MRTDEDRVLAALRESHPPEKATVAVFWVDPVPMLALARQRLDEACGERGPLRLADDSRDWQREYEERLVDLLIASHVWGLRDSTRAEVGTTQMSDETRKGKCP